MKKTHADIDMDMIKEMQGEIKWNWYQGQSTIDD